MEIDAIAKQFSDDGEESFDLMAMSAALTHPGSISFASLEEMVSLAIRAARYQKITRLNCIDHGKPSAQYIKFGHDRVAQSNIEAYRPSLERLREKFDRKAIVHIQNCWAGRNLALLSAFARILGVPVYAGTGRHAPWIGIQLGDYVVAYPDGPVKKHAPRPATPEATDESGR